MNITALETSRYYFVYSLQERKFFRVLTLLKKSNKKKKLGRSKRVWLLALSASKLRNICANHALMKPQISMQGFVFMKVPQQNSECIWTLEKFMKLNKQKRYQSNVDRVV